MYIHECIYIYIYIHMFTYISKTHISYIVSLLNWAQIYWWSPTVSSLIAQNDYTGVCVHIWMHIYVQYAAAAAAAKLLQSCPTLCDPRDGSLPGSPVPGILQARTLEWVVISFSNAWKRKVKVKSLSRVWLLATPWTAAYQAPPSMGFSRQEYWSGVPLYIYKCIYICVHFPGGSSGIEPAC